MLEMGCRNSAGKVELAQFRQGAQLWQTVKVPTYNINYVGDGPARRVVCVEGEGTEVLPHRPDAFFSLFYPKRDEGRRYDHLFL